MVYSFFKLTCNSLIEQLRGESITAANSKVSEIKKKGGLVVYQSLVLLMKCVQAKENATEESGRNLYLFVAFF